MTGTAFFRRVLAPICVASLLVSGAPATAAPDVPGKGGLERPILRLDEDRIDINVLPQLPAHLPVPAASMGIGPGSQLLIDRPDGTLVCTANFIWTTTSGSPVPKKTRYLGAAGHCFLPSDRTSTHGPDADFDPALAAVSVCVSSCEFGGETGPFTGNFVRLGRVAYARQVLDDVALSNDFGIVEIPASIPPDQLRPSIPVWEGPSSVEDVMSGGGVCLYGNGVVVGETFLTKARSGVGEGVSDDERYWTAFMPSLQGDSGSAVVTCEQDQDGLHGRGAAGILTHIGGTQETARTIGTTTRRAAEMTQQDAGLDLRLVLEDGSEVDPPALPPAPPPPPPITPDEAVHPVAVGGSHGWTAGPFDRQAPPESIFFGEECSGTEPKSGHCDYEFVDLDVPAEGASLTVTVSTEEAEADDFDLFVYGPDGRLVGDAVASGTPPEVVSEVVKKPGVYTVAVDPFAVTAASYTGLVELDPAPPVVPDHDGEISLGDGYTWQGDPPLDANPVFTCAEPVNAFCDDELIKVNVPDGGATFVVDITADVEGDDFDVCLYEPTGTQTCSNEVGNEHVELPVTLDGVYRVGVSAFLAPGGGFTGVATLG